MKKYIAWVGVLALLILNIFQGVRMTTLEAELKELQSQNTAQVTEKPVEQPTINQQVSTTIQSDVSDVYDKVVSSVVTVINQPRGTGSGVIFNVENDKAYIVTNNHVIEGNEKVHVILHSGEQLEAQVLGSDALSDIALLEVETDLNLTPMVIGDSSALNIGENVLAIGSPSGQNFSGSLSLGVVSGKDRVIEVDTNNDMVPDWDMVLIQTDAAINPGNSGGALVNMAGQLVGINTLKLLDLSVEGMGFANPINEVMNLLDQIKTHGKVERPMIGISAIAVKDLIARNRYYNLELPSIDYGVYVNEVVNNSPAQRGGIEDGDIIIEIDGTKVEDFKSFRRHLYRFKKGDTIEIKVMRDDQEITKQITL